jgi:hypothetical protein
MSSQRTQSGHINPYSRSVISTFCALSRAKDLALNDVTWVASPSGINGTVLALLNQFEDNQWVYWCMDDRHPKSLISREFQQIERLLEEGLATEIGAILFAPRMFKTKAEWFNRIRLSSQTGQKLSLIPRTNWSTIWMHQYIRAGVIRHLFSYMPDEIPVAVLMDSYLSRIPLPRTQVLYRTFSIAQFLGSQVAVASQQSIFWKTLG